jgi:phosphotransferase system HPr (HPr) family protein
MIEHTLPITLKLTGKNGLDPHASAELAMTVAKFHSHVTIAARSHTVDAKSVAQVMSLGAEHNDLVELYAEGDDAQAAINAMISVIQK